MQYAQEKKQKKKKQNGYIDIHIYNDQYGLQRRLADDGDDSS